MTTAFWELAFVLVLCVNPELHAATDATGAEVEADFASAIAADVLEEPAAQRPDPVPAPALSRGASRPKMLPDISFIMDAGFAWLGRGSRPTQGGHAFAGNGFALQGLELAASSSIDPYFRLDLHVELAHLHIEEAFLTTLSLPLNLQARLGYFNAQIGRHNPRHLHAWRFVNPPLSHTRFMAEEHFSGAGAEVSWLMPLPWYTLVLAEVLDTDPHTRFRSSSFATADRTSSGRTDGLQDFAYVGRLVSFFELTEDWSLNVGLGGALGQSPYVPDNLVNLYAADVYLKWRPVSTGQGSKAIAITLEYLLRDTQVPLDSVRDHGGYVQIDLHLDRFWMVSARADSVDKLRGRAPAGSPLGARHRRGSCAVAYMPTHFSKVRLQLDAGRQRGKPTYLAGFLQVEVSAGHHGAHAF